MQSAPSRRQPAFMLAFLTLVTAFSGCLGGKAPEENVQTPPPDHPNVWANSTPNGFFVDGLRFVAGNEAVSRLYEDDVARVVYTIRHPGSPATNVSRYVTFSLDGVIVDIENVELMPNETRVYEWPTGNLRGRDHVRVELRIANATDRLEASVTPWPRTGDKLDLGDMTLRVNRWLRNPTDGGTDVNVTLYQKNREMDDVGHITAKILCADDDGRVLAKGDEKMPMPGAWTFGTADLRLPGCPLTLYGVHFYWTDDDKPHDQRVLFVENGWRPPNATK